jgi:hypothetical protein
MNEKTEQSEVDDISLIGFRINPDSGTLFLLAQAD